VIVVLTEEDRRVDFMPGSTVDLCYNREVVLSETITKEGYFDYLAIFVFCDNDGTALGNVCGMFGKRGCIPDEISNAPRIKDLTAEQKMTLAATGLVEVV